MITVRKIVHYCPYKPVEARLSFKLCSVLGLVQNSPVVPKYGYRFYCDKDGKNTNLPPKTPHGNDLSTKSQIGFESKYKVFQDADAPILLDVYEEKSQLEQSSLNSIEEQDSTFYGINLERK